MGSEIKKNCKICGAEYSVCLSCERNHGWKIHTDTLEHYYIFLALMSYEVDHDAKRAYKTLAERGFDFQNTSTLKPYAQKMLSEIYDLGREKSRVKRAGTKEKSAHISKPADADEGNPQE